MGPVYLAISEHCKYLFDKGRRREIFQSSLLGPADGKSSAETKSTGQIARTKKLNPKNQVDINYQRQMFKTGVQV